MRCARTSQKYLNGGALCRKTFRERYLFRMSNFFSSAYCSLLVLCFLVTGCESTPYRAPVVDSGAVNPENAGSEASMRRSDAYIIKKGDTMYSIALNHGIDQKSLAEWNNISDPTAIHVGQQLYLSPPSLPTQPSLYSIHETAPPSAVVTTPVVISPIGAGYQANTDKLKTEPRAFKLAYSDQVVAQLKGVPGAPPLVVPVKVSPMTEKNTGTEINPIRSMPEDMNDVDRIDWIWPTKGKISGVFSESAKGIDISGDAGQAVNASADGKVVYSGAGLRGYGKLVIIKHNNTYLSAYAHNDKILVKEGQTVVKGQKIAEMGNSDASLVKLHFEIRKNGKPVDPLKHLPGIGG
ncbi:MAG: peptidoglycan DD-metalloendopeptidase family protein [Nitrosospira sp.]